MIIADLKDIRKYEKLLPYLAEGLEALKGAETKECGRYDFEHGYYLVQEGDTKAIAENTFEGHRRFIDVQIILEGEEEMAWQRVSDVTSVIPYDEAGDKERFEGNKEIRVLIRAGMFWAAFPEDAHIAIGHTKEAHHYRKIVLKLPVE